MKNSVSKAAADIFVITLGSAVFALAFKLFLEPNLIAPGGVSGVAIIVNHFFPVSTGLVIILINIPLLILGFVKFGYRFILSTAYATILSSILIDATAFLSPFTRDPLLAAIYGGVLLGAGIGMVFSRGATTGGSDILVRLIKRRRPHLRMGQIILATDAVVVISAAVAFSNPDAALYAIITIYVQTLLVDAIVYGFDFAEVAYIISDRQHEISERIQTELSRGVTALCGKGGYTGESRKILMCAIKIRETASLHKIVEETDPHAFVIITRAKEIVGDGFKPGKRDAL